MNRLVKIGVITSALLTIAHGSEPFEIPSGHQAIKVNVHAYLKGKPKCEVTLITPEDIQFVLDHLKGLKSRMYDHSRPQIDIEIHFTNNQSVRLRVSDLEIGPGAPASAWNRHWFPKDASLYNFLVQKAYGKPIKSMGNLTIRSTLTQPQPVGFTFMLLDSFSPTIIPLSAAPVSSGR